MVALIFHIPAPCVHESANAKSALGLSLQSCSCSNQLSNLLWSINRRVTRKPYNLSQLVELSRCRQTRQQSFTHIEFVHGVLEISQIRPKIKHSCQMRIHVSTFIRLCIPELMNQLSYTVPSNSGVGLVLVDSHQRFPQLW